MVFMRSNSRERPALALEPHENWAENNAVGQNACIRSGPEEVSMNVIETQPLWQLDIVELAGHNLEARDREEVNRLLEDGWHLLHIYTPKYHEDTVWRERPMAILGRRGAVSKNGVPK
jgi:hypothetical protein